MRDFDARLLEILKTETESELEFKKSSKKREAFIEQVRQRSGDVSILSSLDKDVTVSRFLRYVPWPANRTPMITMNYVVCGSMRILVDHKTVVLNQGDIFIPNQYTLVSREALGYDDIVLSFLIKPQYLENVCIQMTSNTILSAFLLDSLKSEASWDRYLHFTAIDDIALNNLIEAMAYNAFPTMNDERVLNGVDPEPEINAYVMRGVFLALAHNLQALNDDAPLNFDEAIRKVVDDYIEKYYQTASLNELADMLNQSESALSRKIKTLYGVTFKDLLLKKRFDRANTLLRETDLPVADVAIAVGYENTSFFYRKFRELYGLSPKDCRQ